METYNLLYNQHSFNAQQSTDFSASLKVIDKIWALTHWLVSFLKFKDLFYLQSFIFNTELYVEEYWVVCSVVH